MGPAAGLKAEGGPWANEAGLTWDSLRGGVEHTPDHPEGLPGEGSDGLCVQHHTHTSVCLEVGREGSQCEKEAEESLGGGPSGAATGEGSRGS